MAASRIRDASVEVTKDLTISLAVDKASYGANDARRQTLETALRTRAITTDSAAGEADGSYSFATIEQLNLTIDEDYELTPTNVPANSTNYLHVTKGLTDIISFAGVDSAPYSSQTYLTALVFKISSVNGVVTVIQENNQQTGSLLTGDLVPDSGTITDFDYFEWTINNNMCEIEASFEYTPSGADPDLTITITNLDIELVNSYRPLDIFTQVPGGMEPSYARIVSATSIVLDFSTPISTVSVIKLGGSFKVT